MPVTSAQTRSAANVIRSAPLRTALVVLFVAGRSAPRTPARHGGTFAGRRLHTCLEEVGAGPLAGTPHDGLEPEHLAWRRAGFAFAELALLGAEGRDEEPHRRAGDVMHALPESMSRALE